MNETKARAAPRLAEPARGERGSKRMPAALAVVAAGLLLAACGGSSEPVIHDNSGQEWMMRNGYCVREAEEAPVRRVINRVDPELCGRVMKVRSRDYVRVEPPPGTRSR